MRLFSNSFADISVLFDVARQVPRQKTPVLAQSAPSLSQFTEIRATAPLHWQDIAFEPVPAPTPVYPWPPVSKFTVLSDLVPAIETRFLKPAKIAAVAKTKTAKPSAEKTIIKVTAAAPAKKPATAAPKVEATVTAAQTKSIKVTATAAAAKKSAPKKALAAVAAPAAIEKPRKTLTLKANTAAKRPTLSLKEAPVTTAAVATDTVAALPEKPRKTLTLKANKVAKPAPKLKTRIELQMPAEEQKPRSTRKLKAQMAQAAGPISSRSSITEFAAAFKSELQALENGADITGQPMAPKAKAESKKSWKELMAQAEAPSEEPKRNDFDLAAAFKAEMQALQAQQQAENAEKPRLKTAFEPKIAATQPRPERRQTLAA